jgi:hypothetical protein
MSDSVVLQIIIRTDVEHQLLVRKPCPADCLAERVGKGRIATGAPLVEDFFIEIGAVGEVVHWGYFFR